jgi:long-chain acyl-CoA synthetase
MRRWALWEEPDFPRTPTHKIRKAVVREKVLSQDVGRQAGFTLGDKNLQGLDSLGRVALLGELEDRYQIELDEAALTAQTTAQDLEQMIRARAGAAEPALEYPYPRWALRRPVTWLRQLAFHLLIVPFVSVMCRPRARGVERLASLKGPALFIANHVSIVDPGMILFALPSRFRRRMAIAMGGERLRGYRHGGVLDRVSYILVVVVFNVFAIPQKSGFRRSFSYAGAAVDRGFDILIFPEGRITLDGTINPFMAGIGLLATNLSVPVVPVKIEGLFNLKTERRYFSRPGTVTVTFGEPIEIPKGADPSAITRELEKRVRELG